MISQSLHHPAAISRRGQRIAAVTAAALVVALLAATPAPARADGSTPPGTTKTMTLSNANGGTSLALGDVVTVAFDNGQTPEGDYFDIWFCPDKTIAPVAEAAEGDCEVVTFWGRRATNVAADDVSRAVKANELTMTWVFGTDSSPAYFVYDTDEYSSREVSGVNDEKFCDYVGWYLVVHDWDDDGGPTASGGHSNFLGPLRPTGCSQPAPAPVSLPPVLTCTPDPVVPGGTVTCEVTRGDADIDILWRAAFGDDVFASTGVRLGPDGVGSFSFIAPRAAACESVTVELVEWLPPLTVGVTCAAEPTSLPAGEGGLPLGAGLLVLAGVAGAVLVGRRLVTAG